MTEDMLFQGWTGLIRTLVVGTAAYVFLIVLLRSTGNRTLSKLNAFDLIVTVALGSTLATVLLSESVALAEGVAALALLCLLQYGVTWASVRSPKFQAVIKGQPVLVYFRGSFLEEALRRERITREEIFAGLRTEGRAGLDGVEAVVLENDGSLSVLSSASGPAMEPVGRHESGL